MSDVFEDSDENESGEDFSASEDEWQPDKANDSSESEEDETIEDEGEDDTTSESDKDKQSSSKGKQSRKAAKLKGGSSLRAKLFRKYRPPPKTLKPSSPSTSSSQSSSSLPPQIAKILSKSQFMKPKVLGSASAETLRATYELESESDSSSSSSDDEGLVNPAEIVLAEIAGAAASAAADTAPVFDCNAGLRLSDSSDGEGGGDGEDGGAPIPDTQKKETNPLHSKINEKSSAEVRDFSDLQTFHQNLESAKEHLKKLCDDQKASSGAAEAESARDDNTDVTKLLSLGEGTSADAGSQPTRKRKKQQHDSDDSEWENVSGEEGPSHTPAQKDIQITLGTEVVRRDKKKALDFEACLKRRLNRDIKERQVFLHKVSFLGWVAHGNIVNRVLNNQTLMEMCLKLLPSKNAYPDGATDTKYFISFTKWFQSLFELKSKRMYCEFRPLPPKMKSLALQIKSKKVLCKKDLVLIFVSMLRAIGIQCRLVLNIPVAPLRPPQSELLTVSTKLNTEVDQKLKEKAKPKQLKSPGDHDYEKSKSKTTKPKAESLVDKKVRLSVEKAQKNKTTSKSAIPPTSDGLSPAKTSQSSRNTAATKSPTSMENLRVSLTEGNSNKIGEKTPTKNANNQKRARLSLEKLSESMIKRHTGEPSKSREKPEQKSDREQSAERSSKKGLAAAAEKRGKKSSQTEEQPNKVIQSSESTKPDAKRKGKASVVAGAMKMPRKLPVATDSPVLLSRHRNIQATKNVDAEKIFSPVKTRSARRAAAAMPKLPQMDGNDDSADLKSRPKRSSRLKADREDSDSDFAPQPAKIKAPKPKKPVKSPHFDSNGKPKSKVLDKLKKIDLRVLSTDDETDADVAAKINKETTIDVWVEAFNEKEQKWVIIDPVKNKIDATDHVRKFATKPMVYVFAWNNDNSIRDVTPRYSTHFHTAIRKQRAEKDWVDQALRRFVETRNTRTIIEDVEFSKLQMDTPLPTSISEFKNHPLYALERHLLKFEAIYPPNPLTLGYIREEPVYARECVHTLHSREIWVKQARTVKLGEKPYKIVKARPKWDRALNQMLEPLPLEIFGFWQTQPYEPPVAENGIVPRNPYGNVELFKPEMLPIGTRHIQLPSLNRVCKKMNVDCAQAVIGFDFHSGSSHPTFDGFIVCEEFADEVIARWYQEQEEIEEKEQKKYEARVYGNWKKLIKGLYIRERLKNKYNFGDKTKSQK